MSVGMSLLAMLDEGSTYGLQLKSSFEARTGGIWPLNVGQVYTTLARLERDGLVSHTQSQESEAQRPYAITGAGRERLAAWFREPTQVDPPARDELVLKIVMAVGRDDPGPAVVIQSERKKAIELLQEYTRLKRSAGADADLGWEILLDSLMFQTEARVRWLDTCESRIGRSGFAMSFPDTAAEAGVRASVVIADPTDIAEEVRR